MDIVVEEESVIKFQNLITDIAVIASIMASNNHDGSDGIVTRMMGVDILENATDIVEAVFGTDSSIKMLTQVQKEVQEVESNAMRIMEELDNMEFDSHEELIEELLDRFEERDEE